MVSLQTQSLYGDMYCDYSMHYDAMTDTIYLLFTSNGNFYRMVTVDATLGTLLDHGYVGEIVEEDWMYLGDLFYGLTFVPGLGAEEVALLGDADGNGVVNTLDAMMILQYYTNVITAEQIILDNCDVDGNGVVNTVDAMLVLQYYTGDITEFPVE